METIIAALIAAAATLGVCLLNNKSQEKKFEKQLQLQREESERQYNETVNMIKWQLEQVIKKVDLHNNAVERLYIVEKKLEVDEERIRVSNHRIEDLEAFHKP